MNKDQLELDNWLRPHSRLVAFARSCRMEDKSAEGQTKTSTDDAPKSLLDGLDLDSVPEEVRIALEKRAEDLNTIKSRLDISEAEKARILEESKQHQSRADRFHGALKAHNLDPDGKTPQKNESQVYESALEAEFLKGGAEPKAAAAWAKMMAIAGPMIANQASKQMATGLAPFVEVVGDLKANEALQAARSNENDPKGILQIPEVLKQVTDNIKYLTSVGTPIDLIQIKNLANMAYGQHVQNNPDSVIKSTMQSLSTRLSGITRGSNPQNLKQKSNEPQAENEDTQRAVQTTLASMLKGTGVKVK